LTKKHYRLVSFAGKTSSARAVASVNREEKTMAYYEVTVLARPELSATQVTTLQQEIVDIITTQSGTVAKQEYWGLRLLSYPIGKARRAHYLYFDIEVAAAGQHELRRLLGLHENIIRSLIVSVQALQNGPSAVLLAKQRDENKAAEIEGFEGIDGGDQGYRPRRPSDADTDLLDA
jgi:small subunit ribosomal protein S6